MYNKNPMKNQSKILNQNQVKKNQTQIQSQIQNQNRIQFQYQNRVPNQTKKLVQKVITRRKSKVVTIVSKVAKALKTVTLTTQALNHKVESFFRRELKMTLISKFMK